MENILVWDLSSPDSKISFARWSPWGFGQVIPFSGPLVSPQLQRWLNPVKTPWSLRGLQACTVHRRDSTPPSFTRETSSKSPAFAE